MQLIGITGAIGHGKSSLAEAFLKVEPSSLHLESFYIVAEVATQLHKHLRTVPQNNDLPAINNWLAELPAILQDVLHLPRTPSSIVLTPEIITADPVMYDKLFSHFDYIRHNLDLLRQPITTSNKPAYRALLQWLGGYVTTQIDSQAWYREILFRAREATNQGTKLVVVGGLRFPSDVSVLHEAGGIILKIQRPNAVQPDLFDPTERERETLRADAVVLNDAGLKQLVGCAGVILKDLKNSQLKTEYRASSL